MGKRGAARIGVVLGAWVLGAIACGGSSSSELFTNSDAGAPKPSGTTTTTSPTSTSTTPPGLDAGPDGGPTPPATSMKCDQVTCDGTASSLCCVVVSASGTTYSCTTSQDCAQRKGATIACSDTAYCEGSSGAATVCCATLEQGRVKSASCVPQGECVDQAEARLCDLKIRGTTECGGGRRCTEPPALPGFGFCAK